MKNTQFVIIATSLLISCSPIATDQLDGLGWKKYTDSHNKKALRLKPVVVRVENSKMLVNGIVVNDDEALSLISSSQRLDPVPDILLSAKEGNVEEASAIMKRIKEAGLCSGRQCFYEIT